MKSQAYILLLIITAFISSCTKDPVESTEPKIGDDVMYIKGKDLSVIRLRNVSGVIKFHSPISKGDITIFGSNRNLSSIITIKSENGELVIEPIGTVPYPSNLEFFINPLDPHKIIVEGSNSVSISSSTVIDSLELVTQSESRLSWIGLQVNKLITEREGKSKMVLSSELSPVVQERLTYPLMQVLVLDNNHLLYHEGDNRYVLYAPEITTTQDSAYAVRSASTQMRSFFLINEHSLRNKDESDIDARYLPTISVISKNESKSTSLVWATGQLNVRGEGESVMYYFGSPRITKVLNGSSQLLPF